MSITSTKTHLAEHADTIRRLGKQAVENIVEIGRRLTLCKKEISHGDWSGWLKQEFDWSEQQARRFMHVFELAESKSNKLLNLNLPVSSLYLLAAPGTSQEARDEIIERAKSGEPVSVAEVKQTIDTAKGRQQLARKSKPTAPTTTDNDVAPGAPPSSSGLEVTTKDDGKVWANGIRFSTEEEAESFKKRIACKEFVRVREHDPRDITVNVKQFAEPANVWVTGRRQVQFEDGQCGILQWHRTAVAADAAAAGEDDEYASADVIVANVLDHLEEQTHCVRRIWKRGISYRAAEIDTSARTRLKSKIGKLVAQWSAISRLLDEPAPTTRQEDAGRAANDPTASAQVMKARIAALDAPEHAGVGVMTEIRPEEPVCKSCSGTGERQRESVDRKSVV